MVHYLLSLPQSEIKEPTFPVINTRLTPLAIINIIRNFNGAITLPRDHHKHVLQIFCEDLVLFVTFEEGVQIIQLIFLLIRKLSLQKAHLMHDHSHMIKFK